MRGLRPPSPAAACFQLRRNFPRIHFDLLRRLFPKEVCDMENMEPAPLWELFCLTGEPLAYMLYRSAEDEKDNNLS